MTDSPFKYHAFISYSYRDKAWGEWLHQALETYRIPKGIGEHVTCYEKDELPQRLYPVFRDRDELSSAHRISETVMKALGESRALIVICSPNSAGSEWVDNEISTFQRLYPERPILALVVEDSPPDCFPPSLLAEQPLAADARMEGDGKPDAILKLIGGLLGVGFGILKDREIKRKRRRMVTLVSTISAVALGFAGLTLWALKAEQQTRVALVRAEQSAEESKAVLEFFKTRVLAAARPKEQDGGLGIDATIRQAIKAAEPQIEGAFVDQPLVEASIRHDLGETYRYLGDAGAALVEHRRAFELRRSILGSEHLGTLRSMNKLAIAYRDVARRQEALALHRETLDLRKKVLGAEHPDTLKSMCGLADVYADMKLYEQALPLYEEALQVTRTAHGPDHSDTIISMGSLAYFLWKTGQLEAAETQFRELIAVREKQGQNDWALYYDQVSLGAILTQEKIYPEAEKLLLAARAGLESIGSNTGSEWEKRAMGKLVGLYQEWGKSEKASEWEGKLATALQQEASGAESEGAVGAGSLTLAANASQMVILKGVDDLAGKPSMINNYSYQNYSELSELGVFIEAPPGGEETQTLREKIFSREGGWEYRMLNKE